MDHIIVTGWGGGPPLKPARCSRGRMRVYLPRSFDVVATGNAPARRGFWRQLYQFSGGQGLRISPRSQFWRNAARAENRVSHKTPTRRDIWGFRRSSSTVAIGQRDLSLPRGAAQQQSARLPRLAGVTLSRVKNRPSPPGSAIHDAASARMARIPQPRSQDPKPMLGGQDCNVTDGCLGFRTGYAKSNLRPSFALTRRACHHA